MGAWGVQPLFDGGPIDDEVQRLAADAAVVEQRRTRGESAGTGQALVLALEIREQAAQLALQIPHPRAELGVKPDTVQARGPLLVQQLANRGRRRARALDVELQRAAVDGKPLDIDDGQSTPAEKRLQCDELEVAEMCVIKGVELQRLHHGFDVRDLDDGHAAGLQHSCDGGDETVEVADMREHVVGVNDVRQRAFAMQLIGNLGAEEPGEGVDSALACRLRDVGGGLDPQHRYSGVAVELRQVAVVACQLDDQAVGSETARLDGAAGTLPRLAGPG